MSIAGSKGGIYPSTDDPVGFEIGAVWCWREVGARRLSGADAYAYFCEQARPTQVEIGIGNTCGLSCAHCFLGYDAGTMGAPLVPLPRLMEVSTRLVEELQTQVFCVTDRDALTPNRSVPFFTHLGALRETQPMLRFGGITNGLAIDRYADDLSRIRLDYLDVSLDGLQTEHDAIRGAGTFDRTVANLRIASARRVANRLFVSTTLTRRNLHSLLKMITYLVVDEGIEWIDIGPLMAVKLREDQLRERDLAFFLNELTSRLRSLSVRHPVTVVMEICAYCASFIPGLVDSGWLVPEELRQDCYGHVYQDIPINANVKLVLRPELIPEYWRHTVRISADGYVVGGCEPLTQSDYQRFAVGNISNESFESLYKKALSPGSPFHKMMLAYDHSECRDKACFAHCLGGDSLLAHAVAGSYHRKDPNCVWDEYAYVGNRLVHAA